MGNLLMSEKERIRKGLFEMVKQGCLTLSKAAEQAGLSYRQAKRLYKRYRLEGDVGLIHKHRGHESNRKYHDRDKVLQRYKERYAGFGPFIGKINAISPHYFSSIPSHCLSKTPSFADYYHSPWK